MQQKAYSARALLIGSAAALVVFSAIVSVGALWQLIPWGGGDTTVQEALPPAQGETSPTR